MKLNLHSIDKDGVMIFRKDKKNGEREYSTFCFCMGSRDRQGNKTKKYMRVYFDRGVSVPNQSVIYIKKAFLSYDEIDWFVHISDFDIMSTPVDRVISGERPKELNDEMRFL